MCITINDEKEFVVSLIKDDLINTRLVCGLDALGLKAGDYHIHLSQTIFNLMGVEDNRDELFEEYIKMCEQASRLDIFKYPELLNNSARAIYNKLIVEMNKEE